MPDRTRDKKPHSSKPQFQPQSARTREQRQVDRQEVKERFLIVCEGAKTEPNYFAGFRVPSRVLEIKGLGHNTLSLVDEAIRLKQEQIAQAYDQCWCVFDRDSFDDFNNAIRKAQAAGFRVAYTNEAFELWYLLHFDDHRSALSRKQYGPILEQRLGHAYQKNSATIYLELADKQEKAIERAERLLEEYGAAHNPQQDNPCTMVHLLVQGLRKNVPR